MARETTIRPVWLARLSPSWLACADTTPHLVYSRTLVSCLTFICAITWIYINLLKKVCGMRDAGCGALASRIPHPITYIGRVKVAECGFAESSKIALLGFHNNRIQPIYTHNYARLVYTKSQRYLHCLSKQTRVRGITFPLLIVKRISTIFHFKTMTDNCTKQLSFYENDGCIIL